MGLPGQSYAGPAGPVGGEARRFSAAGVHKNPKVRSTARPAAIAARAYHCSTAKQFCGRYRPLDRPHNRNQTPIRAGQSRDRRDEAVSVGTTP